MRVWIVIYDDWSDFGPSVIGVFSTREKAEEIAGKKKRGVIGHCSVEEHVLDEETE